MNRPRIYNYDFEQVSALFNRGYSQNEVCLELGYVKTHFSTWLKKELEQRGLIKKTKIVFMVKRQFTK